MLTEKCCCFRWKKYNYQTLAFFGRNQTSNFRKFCEISKCGFVGRAQTLVSYLPVKINKKSLFFQLIMLLLRLISQFRPILIRSRTCFWFHHSRFMGNTASLCSHFDFLSRALEHEWFIMNNNEKIYNRRHYFPSESIMTKIKNSKSGNSSSDCGLIVLLKINVSRKSVYERSSEELIRDQF